jgi:ubiquinone/menaquinone biosynthesis C-methylase UbiE
MDAGRGSRETAEEALRRLSAGKVLDVATGSGGFISYLTENLGDYEEITGIDLSERGLTTARERVPFENVHFKCMDAARMAFTRGYFDTVCIANSLHHMQDLRGVLAEMLRVCRDGGQVIISEMYCDGQGEAQLTHVYLHHWWAAVDRLEGITHHETYPRLQLVEIIEGLGLRDLRSYELVDEESDPRDPEMVKELNTIIDRYFQRLLTQAGRRELLERGEELRQRVRQVGFRGANSLFVIGQK